MVDALHRAGLEVVLDVVFNHTAEAGPDGPTLCFRGIDNLAYYRTEPGDPGVYYDTTGCGNSLNVGDPVTLQLMMDSLRYWLTEMHADGFRFDLAPTLARQEGAFDKVSAFLDMCSQDPVVCRAKLVAEPWDVGQMDSYDLGRFPPLWREWNGKYRDTMRDFWRSHPVGIGEFANRFPARSDLYATVGRRPTASVNLITVHDGFTLGTSSPTTTSTTRPTARTTATGPATTSRGTAGPRARPPTPSILALRARQSRAMLATLMLSFGVPMLLGGDEMGRTQGGNNNAYCQDNEITWFDWSQPDTELQDFTKQPDRAPRAHPVFRRRRFLSGAEASELQWFTPAGTPMTAPTGRTRTPWPSRCTWTAPMTRTGPKTARGCSTTTSWSWSMPGGSPSASPCPDHPRRDSGRPRSTATTPPDPPRGPARAGDQVTVGPRSIAVLRSPRPASARGNEQCPRSRSIGVQRPAGSTGGFIPRLTASPGRKEQQRSSGRSGFHLGEFGRQVMPGRLPEP